MSSLYRSLIFTCSENVSTAKLIYDFKQCYVVMMIDRFPSKEEFQWLILFFVKDALAVAIFPDIELAMLCLNLARFTFCSLAF